MTLRQLKAAVAHIDAVNLRLAGSCGNYSRMHDEHQIQVDTERRCVVMLNTWFVEGLKVFGPSQTKARILSVPSQYDDFDILMRGVEEDGAENVYERQVHSVLRMDDPTDPRNAGLCLLGPVQQH